MGRDERSDGECDAVGTGHVHGAVRLGRGMASCCAAAACPSKYFASAHVKEKGRLLSRLGYGRITFDVEGGVAELMLCAVCFSVCVGTGGDRRPFAWGARAVGGANPDAANVCRYQHERISTAEASQRATMFADFMGQR